MPDNFFKNISIGCIKIKVSEGCWYVEGNSSISIAIFDLWEEHQSGISHHRYYTKFLILTNNFLRLQMNTQF